MTRARIEELKIKLCYRVDHKDLNCNNRKAIVKITSKSNLRSRVEIILRLINPGVVINRIKYKRVLLITKDQVVE